MKQTFARATAAASAAADRFFAGSAPISQRSEAILTALRDSYNFHCDTTLFATSVDPFKARAVDLATFLASMSSLTPIALGGLGGIPFAGKTGWNHFVEQGRIAGRTDLLLVYCGANICIEADGTVTLGLSAAGEAFQIVQASNGIEGLNDELLSDRYDTQMAMLILETAKVWDADVAAHPEPSAR